MTAAVAGLLLAAGEGRRLGEPKALLEVGGQRLADRGARMLAAGGCAPVHVVVGAVDVAVAGAHTLRNPGWRSGMGSSLRVGLDSLPEDAPAVVVALADQPFITAEAVARLVEAYSAGASVAVAAYGGQGRNPVLLAREHWPEVHARAEGDTGARPFLRAHPELVAAVECGDVADPADIDTREDLERARGRAR